KTAAVVLAWMWNLQQRNSPLPSRFDGAALSPIAKEATSVCGMPKVKFTLPEVPTIWKEVDQPWCSRRAEKFVSRRKAPLSMLLQWGRPPGARLLLIAAEGVNGTTQMALAGYLNQIFLLNLFQY
ncbi:MAG: hypothetical protein KDK99_21555, partial [Verrucomicrobiales bacterium]|nr:hypothetical protein [Verrucomicrobiales bacterium]